MRLFYFMIVAEGRYFLYRHVRLDKNEPFYIGIGTKREGMKSFQAEYKRGFEKRARNPIWHKIANKSSYKVEILLESDNYDFLLQKEIEFIKLYGRINLKTGVLTNLTNGGDGTKGRKHTKEAIQKTVDAHSIKVYHKETKQIYNSITEAATNLGIDNRKLSSYLKKQVPKCPVQYVDENLIQPYINKLYLVILQKSTGKLFKTLTEMSKTFKFTHKKVKELLEDPNSDFECISKRILPKKKINKKSTPTIHIPTSKIYPSIKIAWENSKMNITYNSFKNRTLKTFKFEYATCDLEGNITKRMKRLPKSEKQIESAKKALINYRNLKLKENEK